MTIIGAGPAGLAAAIYLQRAGLSPLLLEKGQPGGLLNSANLVENYPGFPGGIRGKDLVSLFVDQLAAVGARVTRGNVLSVDKEGGTFKVRTRAKEYSTSSVLIATGTSPSEPDIAGCSNLRGKGVYDEITEIPPHARRKSILIIGGGDAAFDYALNLKERGHNVTIVSRSEPHALRLLKKRATTKGVDVRSSVCPKRVFADTSGLRLTCTTGRREVNLGADMILMACGRTPNTGLLAPRLMKKIGTGHKLPETDVSGLYMLGDVARGNLRQTGIAVGDGIRAAMMVQQFLEDRRSSK